MRIKNLGWWTNLNIWHRPIPTVHISCTQKLCSQMFQHASSGSSLICSWVAVLDSSVIHALYHSSGFFILIMSPAEGLHSSYIQILRLLNEMCVWSGASIADVDCFEKWWPFFLGKIQCLIGLAQLIRALPFQKSTENPFKTRSAADWMSENVFCVSGRA